MYKRIVVGLSLFGLLTVLLGACAIVDTAAEKELQRQRIAEISQKLSDSEKSKMPEP